MSDQAEIHRICVSDVLEDRQEAVELLETHFSNLANKDQASQDLHRLTKDEDRDVRAGAAHALGSAFYHILDKDKDQASQDFYRLTQDENNYARMYAYHSLGRASVLKATETGDKGILRSELEAAVNYFEKSFQNPLLALEGFAIHSIDHT